MCSEEGLPQRILYQEIPKEGARERMKSGLYGIGLEELWHKIELVLWSWLSKLVLPPTQNEH